MILGLFDSFFQKVKSNDRLHLAWCVGGIIGCLVLYGILQERIMQEPFGGERFTYSLLLVLCNRLVTVAVASSLLIASGQDIRPVAPPQAYAAVSVSNVVATFCQYEALRHVSFPLQTLGKCAKMIPVMVWGTFIMRKRYNVKDYAIAAIVTLGCTLFLTTGEISSKHSGSNSSAFGIALMIGYLGFDGFTSTFQDKLFKGYQMTIYNQILYVQAFSAGFSTLGLVTAGQFTDAISFVLRHPDALTSIVTLSAAATVGQLFISHTIRTYGALLFATVMTTRQFLSILLSCILFAHPLSLGQWAGTATVFGALYYKTLSKKDAKSSEGTQSGGGGSVPASPGQSPLQQGDKAGKESESLDMERQPLVASPPRTTAA